MRDLNQQLKCEVVTNKKEFIFDYSKMCSERPYFTKNGDWSFGFYIESVSIEKEKLHIVGWLYGSSLRIHDVPENQYFIERQHREDVNNAFKLQEAKPAGFALQINCYSGLEFTLASSEISVEFKLTEDDIEREDEFTLTTKEVKNINRSSQKLLIVGGAPSVKNHKREISNHNGDIWALNDAIFWLENEHISVTYLIVSDQRFVDKNLHKLPNLKCKSLIIANYISLEKLNISYDLLYRVEIVGRTGISDSKMQAFHGCTVAHLAFQLARLLNFEEVLTTGIILGFPTNYERIDGSKTMPEYVHNVQIENVKKIIQVLRSEDVKVQAFELESNINYF